MIRSFSTTAVRAIKPIAKPHHTNPGVRSFDKSLPENTKRAWEVQGISKDEFFMRKYGNISPEERQKLNDKVDRQRRFRQMRKDHEREQYLQENPKKVLPSRNRLFEYVHGTHSVRAALENPARKSYSTLFHHNGDRGVIELAREKGVKIVKSDRKGLNNLTSNGVHNGVVLETKPVYPVEVNCLGEATGNEYSMVVYNEATNETTTTVSKSVRDGYPVGLLLDEITDPMNFGGIVRTAFFMGVDFVIVPEMNSARMGPVANKASVGALEKLPVFVTGSPVRMVHESKKNGWTVVTAGVPIPGSSLVPIDLGGLSELSASGPMLLVMGSEGSGVRKPILNESDFTVAVAKARSDDQVVDSLNVSVATGIIVAAATGQW